MKLKTFSRKEFNESMSELQVNDSTVEKFDNSFFISCVSTIERGSDNEKRFFTCNHRNATTEIFDDITPSTFSYFKSISSNPFGFVGDYNPPEYKLFDKNQARNIVNFVELITKDSRVYIHCTAGISRSGAIGYYIANKYGLINQYLKDNPQVSPNPHVLSLLLEASNEINHTSYRTGDVVKDAQRRTRLNYYM